MGNVSGEWIIYGVEWDNPEKAPYKRFFYGRKVS